MVTLAGKIADVTGRAPDSISSITVKAPSARIGGGTDVIVSSPATVNFNRATGDITISGLTGGLSWLYIEGDGWADSVPLAVAEGFQLILEAVANASGVPGITDYVSMLRNSGEHAQLLARAAVDGEIGEVVRRAEQSATSAAQDAKSADIRSISAETTVNAYTPRVDALEAMAGLNPESPVDGQTANLIAQEDTLTRKAAEKAAILASPHVDARALGLTEASPTADVSGILNAAATEARAKNRPLFIPAGTLYIDSTVNLRRLDVICEANIVVRHTDAPGVIVGDVSTRRGSRTISLRDVKHVGTAQYLWQWDHPALRVIGIKGSYVKVGAVSLMELFADGASTSDDSIGYNLFQTQRVNHLRLRGVNGKGWINQNLFLAGSFHRITLDGTYTHNANRWAMPSVEGPGSIVDIQSGMGNVFEDARTEGGTQISFGPSTYYNVASSLFSGNEALLHDGFIVSQDQGIGNVTTTRSIQNHAAETLFSVGSHTPLYDTASTIPSTTEARVTPSVGGGKLATPSSGWWFDTGIIPIELVRNPSARNLTLNPRSRMTRFVAYSDTNSIRPYVTVYDADSQVISASEVQSISSYGSWGTDAAGTSFALSAQIDAAVIIITNPDVKFIRVRWYANASTLFTHATLVGYYPSGEVNTIAENAREMLRRPLYASSKPTQGLAWPGVTIQGPAGLWKSVARVDTTVSNVNSSTELTLASATGIEVDDVIGVLMPSGQTHWTKVTAKTGAGVTLATAPSSSVRVGAAVGTTRWLYVPDVQPNPAT